MVYINITGTPEGDEQCRRLNLRAQAAEDQRGAFFRNYCVKLPPEARSAIAEAQRSSQKARPWLGPLQQYGVTLPTPQQMLTIIDAIDAPADPESD